MGKKPKKKMETITRTTLLFLCLWAATACSSEIRIRNASELVLLSKAVNSGTNHSGTTVLLDADVDFSGDLSEQFEPIGKDRSHYFLGVFNGQGHMISNLTMNPSSQDVGLFGYSNGATIRNVVLGSSCTVKNIYNNTRYEPRTGGVIGNCY